MAGLSEPIATGTCFSKKEDCISVTLMLMPETMRYFLESKCRSSWVIAVPPFALALMLF